MKKILDVIKENEAIACKTYEEAQEYCDLAHEQGLIWSYGWETYKYKRNWHLYESNTVYLPHRGQYGYDKKQKEGVVIISFEEFKNRLKENSMNKELKIELPEGFEFDCVENGVIICKELKKELPKTITDCINLLSRQDKNSYWISASNGNITKSRYFYNGSSDLPSEQIAIAVRALQKLLVAREVYRDGWEPDWKKEDGKYVICNNYNEIKKAKFYSTSHILAFQSEELRDEFYKNFKDLIEEAKELL